MRTDCNHGHACPLKRAHYLVCARSPSNLSDPSDLSDRAALFVTGESFAGKYIPALCTHIHSENAKQVRVPKRLASSRTAFSPSRREHTLCSSSRVPASRQSHINLTSAKPHVKLRAVSRRAGPPAHQPRRGRHRQWRPQAVATVRRDSRRRARTGGVSKLNIVSLPSASFRRRTPAFAATYRARSVSFLILPS